MDKDIVICIVGIVICHLLVFALADLECKPGSLKQAMMEQQSRLKSFAAQQIVPDVIRDTPSNLLTVTYRPGVAANLGNELRVSDVVQAPKITWTANANDYYTLVAVDADAPSRINPSNRAYQHWLVVNIRGGLIERGETLTQYKPPTPPVGSGLHRYVFLMFKQPGKLEFHEPQITLSPGSPSRTHFNVMQFSGKYSLGVPIAGNFFQALAQ